VLGSPFCLRHFQSLLPLVGLGALRDGKVFGQRSLSQRLLTHAPHLLAVVHARELLVEANRFDATKAGNDRASITPASLEQRSQRMAYRRR
jgi:hypothetical protein